MKESPIFTRLHDLQLWLLRTTRKFPRDQRFVLGQRLVDQIFALQDALVAATVDTRHTPIHLMNADIAITGLRKTLLLCHQMEFLSDGQYQHVSGMVAEVGRLLGGWQKQAAGKK
jgi:hypothetical protein